ncbi:hypothetical protein FXW30_02985 [Candidatus Liberibacter asiaticus]|nr:hypothetical protein FXW31_03890 [Candidatus Liberibacter asiaticus]KAE9512329.1 hypothetical protein FXW32_02380 [Candidatus Liberibacter asiaticus]KAE9513412.1 hypothetical protein FXW35_02505 [Candidatus Liberibacter asiaticus]KAE9519735.1 hypothetical protein FXW29_03495 [Candidatus Liberibacter asiaticus]KAE9520784.1 hypothetical protein FXW30_02985 [Candidatus Liberibacter asiaticus]
MRVMCCFFELKDIFMRLLMNYHDSRIHDYKQSFILRESIRLKVIIGLYTVSQSVSQSVSYQRFVSFGRI